MHPDSFQTNISLYFGDNLKFLNVKWDIFCLFQVHRQRKVSSPESGSTVGLRRVTERLLNDDHHSHSSGSPMTRGSKVTSALVLIPKNCKTVYSSFLVLSFQVRDLSVLCEFTSVSTWHSSGFGTNLLIQSSSFTGFYDSLRKWLANSLSPHVLVSLEKVCNKFVVNSKVLHFRISIKTAQVKTVCVKLSSASISSGFSYGFTRFFEYENDSPTRCHHTEFFVRGKLKKFYIPGLVSRQLRRKRFQSSYVRP